MGADVIVPVRHGPATMGEAAILVLFCAAWSLDHSIKADELPDNQFSHPPLLAYDEYACAAAWRSNKAAKSGSDSSFRAPDSSSFIEGYSA
jgi:hypothetical protein